MPAYIVFMREKTLDNSELEKYRSKVPPTLDGHPIKVLASYGRHAISWTTLLTGRLWIVPLPAPQRSMQPIAVRAGGTCLMRGQLGYDGIVAGFAPGVLGMGLLAARAEPC